MKDFIYRREQRFEPDFSNLLKVLSNETPSRPTLFEFAINDRIIGLLSGEPNSDDSSRMAPFKRIVKAFSNGGYDYVTISAWRTDTLAFPKNEFEKKSSHSLNAGNMISDRNTFEQYKWPDAGKGDYEIYDDIAKILPGNMKIIASGNGGVLENTIDLVGFENLSMMSLLDPGLTKDIFDNVGSRLLQFYEIVSSIDSVGACIVNDDWGFKTQTMFSPEALREFVFPWHKKIVQAIHTHGKKAILHSCGQLNDVMEDVIADMRYDAKHSFEDQILPVEDVLEKWGKQIAILGGIDMDFLARSSEEDIRVRSEKLIEKGMSVGGYALGSGNSIPEFIPDNNFFAMISTVK